ncbi:MAG: zf-HC2 domain-containing protein [Candidatus Acidiferrales bacterium]
MDHSEAIRSQATERYLLGELSGDLREQFEDHYFSCAECAADLKYSAMFVESAKSVMAVPPVLAPAHATRGWLALFLRPSFAAAALALLLAVVGYQNFVVIPGLRTGVSQLSDPQALQTFTLAAGISRGAEPPPIAVGARPFALFVDLPPVAGHFSSYLCDFQSEAGALEFSLAIPAARVTDSISLLIPASRLSPGKHILVVRGLAAGAAAGTSPTEIARYPFTLVIAR